MDIASKEPEILAEARQLWLRLPEILRRIRAATGWKIPTQNIRAYLRSSKVPQNTQVVSLKRHRLGRFVVVRPQDVEKIVAQQTIEISRFKVFCQQCGLGEARTFAKAKAVVNRCGLTSVSRTLGLDERRLDQLVKVKQIPSARFNIIGLLSGWHRRLVSLPGINNVLRRLGEELSGPEAKPRRQLALARRILISWWTTDKISAAIQKHHPGWRIQATQIKEYVRRVCVSSVASLWHVTGERRLRIEPVAAERIVRAQVAAITRLQRFAGSPTHFRKPRRVLSPQDAEQIQAEWGPEAVMKDIGLGHQAFGRLLKNHQAVRRFFPVIGIGERRFSLISQTGLARVLREVERRLRRLNIDPRNGRPTVKDLLTRWQTVGKIAEEIERRTGWVIPEHSLRPYLRSGQREMGGLPVFSLREFTGRFHLFVPPVEAQALVDSQCSQIHELELFLEESLGRRRPFGSRHAMQEAARYRARAIQKDLGISEGELRRLLRDGSITRKSFSIIGMGRHQNLFMPCRRLRIELLIRAYQRSSGAHKKDTWVRLVRLAQSDPEEFCRTVLDSKEPAVEMFRRTEGGECLMKHLKRTPPPHAESVR